MVWITACQSMTNDGDHPLSELSGRLCSRQKTSPATFFFVYELNMFGVSSFTFGQQRRRAYIIVLAGLRKCVCTFSSPLFFSSHHFPLFLLFILSNFRCPFLCVERHILLRKTTLFFLPEAPFVAIVALFHLLLNTSLCYSPYICVFSPCPF